MARRQREVGMDEGTNAFIQGRDGSPDRDTMSYPTQPTPEEAGMLAGNQSRQQEMTDAAAGMQKKPIGVDEIRKARQTLDKYKRGKTQLEDRIIRNEKWWKMRHWDLIENKDNWDDPKPASGWLFNVIISKHADYMDSFPSPDILPREIGDVQEAKTLSSIIPVVLDQVGFKHVYSEEVWMKLKSGTGIYGVFWDQSKLNGLGDISIKDIDPLTVFWEPGVKDIQDSRNFFSVELVDNDLLERQYPELRGQLVENDDVLLKKYLYDENISTEGKSAVIDWYYKVKNGEKTTLQYCKFVGEKILYSSENDMERPTQQVQQPFVDENGQTQMGITEIETGEPSMAERGFYDHGLYPFVFDVLFPDTGMPTGFGYVDVCKNPQTSIDIYNNCFEKNAQFAAAPRYIFRTDGGINEEEFTNPNCLVVHSDANLGQDSYAVIAPPTFVNSNYIAMLEQKINEMKEVSGNRDVTTGGTGSGVTAASAVAALQESAGKTSRDQIARAYEAYKGVVNLVIELIRQFYDLPRTFRITGEDGSMEFQSYTNAGIKPISQGNEFGIDMGMRLPVFDIKVAAEKESAYSQLSQNELALQFYNQGFFNPQNTDQALACIDMMEFEGKQAAVEKIQENGGMYQQLIQLQGQVLQMAQMIDQLTGTTNLSGATADAINQNLDMQAAGNGGGEVHLDPNRENSIVAKARANAAASTAPR